MKVFLNIVVWGSLAALLVLDPIVALLLSPLVIADWLSHRGVK